MSAERFEIRIDPAYTFEVDIFGKMDVPETVYIDGPMGGYSSPNQNVIGAIRQQARDLDQLRADLAAAVAERDGLGYYRAEFEPIWDGLQDALEGERQIDSYGLGESEVECVRRVLRERDQLRGELAAAVAERSEYWGALHSTRDELFECRANQRTLESDLRITRDQRDTLRTSIEDPGIGWRVSLQRWRQRAEQAEARLAAIEAAPTVAKVSLYHGVVRVSGSELPPIGTELIARPAKD